jgi:hypothetical protein
MKIPVFVSCPTKLSSDQEAVRNVIIDLLAGLNLEPRALGRTDYPTEFPLREVYTIARHCSGGIILGFGQFKATKGVWHAGTSKSSSLKGEAIFPTPWNNLEAGILFALRKPLLVFRERGVEGGVFDPGVTDVFVHDMPKVGLVDQADLREVLLKWRDKVGADYYS